MSIPVQISVYDMRLGGHSPTAKSSQIIDVSEKVPLTNLFGLLTAHTLPKTLKLLKIYCHGSPGYLELCSEGVNIGNVARFAVLKDLFTNGAVLEIYGCNVALTENGSTAGAHGDGGAFCSKLAQICNTRVKAAIHTQVYRRKPNWWPTAADGIDFGDWEGPVYTYNNYGKLSGISH